MKKLIFYIIFLFFLVGPVCAQNKPSQRLSVGERAERMYAQMEAEHLKSYYTDRETANACEAWHSCAKWAFEQYVQDQSFKVIKAQFHKKRKIVHHRTVIENHLFVEATQKKHTLYVEFLTPKTGDRARSYKYITQFPKSK